MLCGKKVVLVFVPSLGQTTNTDPGGIWISSTLLSYIQLVRVRRVLRVVSRSRQAPSNFLPVSCRNGRVGKVWPRGTENGNPSVSLFQIGMNATLIDLTNEPDKNGLVCFLFCLRGFSMFHTFVRCQAKS